MIELFGCSLYSIKHISHFKPTITTYWKLLSNKYLEILTFTRFVHSLTNTDDFSCKIPPFLRVVLRTPCLVSVGSYLYVFFCESSDFPTWRIFFHIQGTGTGMVFRLCAHGCG